MCGHPTFCFGGRGKRGNRHSILSSVSAWSRGERTGRTQVGHVTILSRCLEAFHFPHVVHLVEHVEFRRYAERDRVLEGVAIRVGVGVD